MFPFFVFAVVVVVAMTGEREMAYVRDSYERASKPQVRFDAEGEPACLPASLRRRRRRMKSNIITNFYIKTYSGTFV